MNALRNASAIVGGVGVILLGVGLYLLQSRLIMIRTWRPVSVQVIGGTVQTKQGDGSTYYTARWELAYVVDGKPFRTTVESPGSEYNPEAAERMLARHPAGTTAILYFDPDNPTQIRLNLGKNIQTLAVPLWFLLGAMSLLMFGLSFWLMGTPGVNW